VILELQADYSDATETFPITIPGTLAASAANTITIRPAPDAEGLSLVCGAAAATLVLNGADYVSIDGRPGGTNTSCQLTIGNTGGSEAVLLQNQATCNNC
jgi:trimeric autotransporter adhesin